MNNIYNTISDMNVPNGSTKRINCPNCNGYKTFTVTNNMGSLVWNCYKASCGIKGSKRVHLTMDDLKSWDKTNKGIVEPHVPDIFNMPEYVVPHNFDIAEWASELYKLDATELGLLHDVKDNRVVFPIVCDGVTVDAVGRSLTGRLPKWKRYGKNSLPYHHGYGRVAVVVEDCVSAAVVGDDVFVGVAVLGTSLSEEHKRFLSRFSTAIIALDPDALKKTLAIAKELRGHVAEVKVLKLTDDLKYRNPTDIENLHSMGV